MFWLCPGAGAIECLNASELLQFLRLKALLTWPSHHICMFEHYNRHRLLFLNRIRVCLLPSATLGSFHAPRLGSGSGYVYGSSLSWSWSLVYSFGCLIVNSVGKHLHKCRERVTEFFIRKFLGWKDGR